MSFIRNLFGGKAQPSRNTSVSSELNSGQSVRSKASAAGSSSHNRREMLRVVLRDTLQHQGIPLTWVAPELLTSTSRDHKSGIHVRLVLRHWDERLPVHLVSLQNTIINRLHRLDPVAEEWLMGISWQFDLEDDAACPPMPHPGTWTAQEPARQRPAAKPAPEGADVIAGPVHVGRLAAGSRAELEKQLAKADGDYNPDASGSFAHEATQPMGLNSRPGKLG